MHRTLACLFVTERQWKPNILHCGGELLLHSPMHKDMDGSRHVALNQGYQDALEALKEWYCTKRSSMTECMLSIRMQKCVIPKQK